ncbi:MAG: Lacal_2735 family protein [Cyclobacteriaceae bacterium]
MFNLFRKKSAVEKLEIQYRKLLEESYKLSTIDRKLSDAKQAEAEEVLKQIEIAKDNN